MQRNTLITLSDNKIGVDNNADNKADFYTASVLSATDYYAFGMSMKERSWQSESYRYGFNGKEKDSDIGEEVEDFGERLANKKIGRFFSPDRFEAKFSHQSTYVFAGNSPMMMIDHNGDSTHAAQNKQLAYDIVNDLNIIYKHKYGDKANVPPFKVVAVKIKIVKPKGWFQDDEITEVTRYYITTNKGFNWNADEYTKAIFDILNTNKHVRVDNMPGNTETGNKNYPLSKAHGYTVSKNLIYLYDKLPTASTSDWNEAHTSAKWTKGSTFKHETTYHLHYMEGMRKDKQEGPSRMQSHFNLSFSSEHGTGGNQLLFPTQDGAEIKRLEELRKEFSKKPK